MPTEFVLSQCLGFLNTPPLWVNEQFGIQQFVFPKLNLTNFKPTLIPQKLRLGHQMEYVFKQLIEHSVHYEILVHNIPIRRDKQTLGEIDFILKEVATDKLIHVEMTYKFYIINPEIAEPIHRIIGPNKRDAFFAKTEKIRNQQFPLLHSEEGIKSLKKSNINPYNISQQTCYKGQLFTLYGSSSSHIGPLNEDCICGFWLPFDDFNSSEFKNYQFYIPHKSEWVFEPHTEVSWMSHFETLMDVNLRMLNERAPMIWMKKSDTAFEKLFVVWWK